MLTPAQVKRLTEAKARLASGVMYAHPDLYYGDKDLVRELEAKTKGKTARQHDPMGYWHGMQSN